MKLKLKHCLAMILVLAFMLALSACNDGGENEERQPEKLNIICSLFPVYDFTRQIARGHADVFQLLPNGMDSHEYEPSVGDMASASRADLFIYTDDVMEIWIGTIAGSLNKDKLIRCAEGIDLEELNEQWELIEHENEGEEEEHEHAHEHKYDAHIWLDPTLAAVMCENIRDALIRIDPANAGDYTANCLSLTEELQALDQSFAALFQAHPNATLYFGGRFAYSHFIRRYGLKYLSAFDSCGEEEEVNLLRLLQIVQRMRDEEIKYVFTDEMSNGLIAEEISRETGAKILLFHSGHTVSDSDAGLSYIDIMKRNYDNVKRALGEG